MPNNNEELSPYVIIGILLAITLICLAEWMWFPRPANTRGPRATWRAPR